VGHLGQVDHHGPSGDVPAQGHLQRLVGLIGATHAKYLALTGTRVPAEKALSIGLLHETVPSVQLMERAMGLAANMAAKSPIALQLTKQLVNAASGEDAAATLEAMAGALAANTEDGAEGIRSFREKRAPSYKGR